MSPEDAPPAHSPADGAPGVGAAPEAAGIAGSPGRVVRPPSPRARWYRHLAPAVLQLDCGGGRHTVRWHKGRLVLLDHDVGAEVALMALGADRPACLTLLERWRGCFAPGAVRAPAAPARRGGAGGSGLRSVAAAGGDLRSFGAELSSRIELARLVRAERRWADPALPANDRQHLVDTFLNELRSAFAQSLQPTAVQRGRQQLQLHARPLPSGEEASAEVTTSASRIQLDLSLPLGWVIDVAGRGLAPLPGRMVLAVVDRDPQRAALGVAGIVWDVAGPGRVTARLERWWTQRSEGTWTVLDDGPPIRSGLDLWWSTSGR